MKINLNNFKQHLPIILLLLILGVAGISNYRTYGTQWDEYLQREMGRYNYNYITGANDSLNVWRGRDYGIVVELPLYVLEKQFAPDKPAKSIYIRHFACYVLFIVGVFFFYLALLKLRFNSYWAVGGALMLVISPRIYGHSFINSKDVPLMVFYIMAFYSLLCFVEKPTFKRSFFHALCTALLIDTRITGVIIVPVTLLFFILFEYQRNDYSYRELFTYHVFKKLNYYLGFSALLVYLFWPYLWLNPIKHFLVAFLNMTHFRWKGYNFLFGEFLFSFETPWYFSLVWIAITTPLLYLVLFFTGISHLFKKIIHIKIGVFKEKEFLEQLLALTLFSAPLLAIIVFKSVLYDTWRHVYFVYPFLLIVSIYGGRFVLQQIKNQLVSKLAIVLYFSLLSVELVKMARAFPHEYVYFNELVSADKEHIRYHYDMDYWGITFKKGLEKILELDQRDTIKITGNVYPCYSNYILLKHDNPDCRLEYVLKENEADYYLTTYRFKPNDHDNAQHKKVYSITYRNSEILGVYKVK